MFIKNTILIFYYITENKVKQCLRVYSNSSRLGKA